MSGGRFGYSQYQIGEIAREIQHCIDDNGKPDDYGQVWKHPDNVIAEFKNAIAALKLAEIYAQRVDWYLSGDDGEECLFRRLKEDLAELEKSL